MKKLLLTAVFISLLCLTACSSGSASSSTESDTVEVLLDVQQFAGISEQELIEKMGEPETREEWNYESVFSIFPMVSCYYSNNRFEFLLNNDHVVRVSIHADTYNSLDGESFTFTEKEDILKMFGIDPKDVKYAKLTDTNSALRYENFLNITSFWVPSYENNSFDEVKIDFSDLFERY